MSDNNSSGMIVAIVAIVVIIAVGFFVLRAMPAAEPTNSKPSLDVNLNTNGDGQ